MNLINNPFAPKHYRDLEAYYADQEPQFAAAFQHAIAIKFPDHASPDPQQ